MRLALVGSRNFIDYKSFKLAIFKTLQEWNKDISDIKCIISGGAKGADTLAEQFAREFNIETQIYRVDWKQYGRGAGLMRNTTIVNDSTNMIAFPSKFGKGTQDSIRKAHISCDKVKVLYID